MTKTRRILGWVLGGMVSLLLMASAADKIIGSEHALSMGASFGLSAVSYRVLGMIEFGSAILILIPRTGLLGTFLLAAYMGGAIATHLQHQQGIAFPVGIETFVAISALLRFPELTERILGRKGPNS